jgi:hypothetical protein
MKDVLQYMGWPAAIVLVFLIIAIATIRIVTLLFVTPKKRSVTDKIGRSWIKDPYDYNIFIAGSTQLENEHARVRSTISKLCNEYKTDGILIFPYNFKDIIQRIGDTSHQNQYFDFIANKTDVAIFILDEIIGGTTLDEFNVAYASFLATNKPSIYVFYRNNKGVDAPSKDIIDIKQRIKSISAGMYWCLYDNLKDLEKDCENRIRQEIQDFIRTKKRRYV